MAHANLGVGPCEASAIPVGTLTEIISARVLFKAAILLRVMGATSLLGLEDTMLPQASGSSGSYDLSAHPTTLCHLT